MTSRSVNLWQALGWFVLAVVTGGVVWAGVSGPVNMTSETGTAIPSQLGKNPGAGKVLQMPTGTDQRGAYWTTIKTLPEGVAPGDVPQVTTTGTNTDWGVTNISGAPNYLAKFGTGGVINSNAYESGGALNVSDENLVVQNNGGAFFLVKNASDSDGPRLTLTRQFGSLASPANISGFSLLGLYDFTAKTVAGYPTGAYLAAYSSSPTVEGYLTGQLCAVLAGGTATNANVGSFCATPSLFDLYTPLRLTGTTSKGIGKFLYFSDADGTVAGKDITASDLGINGFDPLGTYFLHYCEGPCFIRWGTFEAGTAVTSSATCSSGNDALIAEFFAYMTPDFENRILWPGGSWLAKLNAKVNANGAAIRVEVWDTDGSGGYASWFNWTTDTFTNTAFAVIQKSAQAAERIVASRGHRVFFRLYATCSSSTTVTLQYADGSSRLESPMAKEAAPSVSDVVGLTASLADKEPAIPAGTPGQAVGYAGTGTATTTNKGPLSVEPALSGRPGQVVGFAGTGTATTVTKTPVDREPVISGVPGQFVKIAGTGTSTATTKEAVTVTVPTPVTTRTFTVAASALNLGSGAVAGNLSSNLAIWTLRNSQSDYAYGAVITVPNDYASGLSVAPLWYPINADSTQTHTVKWAIGHMAMSDAASYTLTYTSWTGKACGAPCPATYALVRETAFGFGSYSAGDVVAIGIKRLGSDASDTYTGDLALAGLKFTYTSSL